MSRSAVDAGSSRTEYVFEHLRSEMLDGVLAPGQRLKLPALAERFGLSMTVIREALTRLAEQGLAVASPKRGFSVMPLSVHDLKDLTQARVRLEVMTLRDSIDIAGIAWETAVVGSHHTLSRTDRVFGDGTLNPTWLQAHRRFHAALGSGCESARLNAITSSLRDSAELYRAWSHSLAHDTGRDVAAEHELIVIRALDRDADAAADALTSHIERTTAVLLEYALRGNAAPEPQPRKAPSTIENLLISR